MNKSLLLFFFLIAIAGKISAQDNSIQLSKPCYTKHWVDSVNAVSQARMNGGIPNLVEWYSYEGQTVPPPRPSAIVNVVKVKLEEQCPAEKPKEKQKAN